MRLDKYENKRKKRARTGLHTLSMKFFYFYLYYFVACLETSLPAAKRADHVKKAIEIEI